MAEKLESTVDMKDIEWVKSVDRLAGQLPESQRKEFYTTILRSYVAGSDYAHCMGRKSDRAGAITLHNSSVNYLLKQSDAPADLVPAYLRNIN